MTEQPLVMVRVPWSGQKPCADCGRPLEVVPCLHLAAGPAARGGYHDHDRTAPLLCTDCARHHRRPWEVHP